MSSTPSQSLRMSSKKSEKSCCLDSASSERSHSSLSCNSSASLGSRPAKPMRKAKARNLDCSSECTKREMRWRCTQSRCSREELCHCNIETAPSSFSRFRFASRSKAPIEETIAAGPTTFKDSRIRPEKLSGLRLPAIRAGIAATEIPVRNQTGTVQ